MTTSDYQSAANQPEQGVSQHGVPPQAIPQHEHPERGGPQYGGPGRGQPQYGAPQGGPQYGAAPQAGGQVGAGVESLDPKVGGLLAYFTWIGGLIMYLTQRHREVRFHAAQSILFNIVVFAAWVALWIVEFALTMIFSPFGLVTLVLFPLLGLAVLAVWILLAIRGYNLVHFKLPIIGAMAEKWADK
ncbi:DUF4870 domain-containing protein [Pseudactinotalea sp. Z1748]|uniref:DUF4870 domain-containing protein n=1 Tax=Pseudactinotalea sp. Z1748 TaxID=3413027 RepID=UPI003C7E6A01